MQQGELSALGPVGRCILIPVANPASVRPLLRLAAQLLDEDGRIELVSVLPPDADTATHADAWQGMARAEALADTLGVSASGRILTGDALGDTVLDEVRQRDASLVLMGWRGASSTTDVFGRLIDHIVGRSSAPLAIVRFGATDHDRVLLPVSADHLLPGGASGLSLAAELAGRLRRSTPRPATVLRTGPGEVHLPPTIRLLGDRVHHDPRRTHHAVAAFAGPSDLVVAAVAPTVSGLRAATTHLAWAAPDATLLVAVDAGRRRDSSLVEAVSEAGQPAPAHPRRATRDEIRIVVTVRLPEGRLLAPQQVEQVVGRAGRTEQAMAWWPAGDSRPHIRLTVQVHARDLDRAVARVAECLSDAAELTGAEISYEPDTGTPVRLDLRSVSVTSGELSVIADQDRSPTHPPS